ncbi:MAG TPA: recombinase family protein [Solirubrobacteraceae bacterium]|jgi:DNA invertase Pin-like site-specific DNA recombinase|nr:recombinase family protein [Solirubrobacteraceae bacterium]
MALTLTKQADTEGPDTVKRAVLYLRVASADPRDQREGIARQREACQCEAERLGAMITDEYIDVGASGNSKGRAGLRRLLRRIVRQPVEYVIARDHSRLARNPVDHAEFDRHIDRAGASLVVADELAVSATVITGLLGRAS